MSLSRKFKYSLHRPFYSTTKLLKLIEYDCTKEPSSIQLQNYYYNELYKNGENNETLKFIELAKLYLNNNKLDVKDFGDLANEKKTSKRILFNDVKGCPEAKTELQETVAFLQKPQQFNQLGGKIQRGVLLIGPPGTGKTLLAKAVAGEANVPFFYVSGSEFDEKYVGVGAKRMRELFNKAKSLNKPCVIFIDEIDAIGAKRSMSGNGYHDTLNQLLTEMDGFTTNDNIVIIAATNLADTLDAALLRAGRFDKHVHVPLPDIGGRKEIIELYLEPVARLKKLSPDVKPEIIAKGTTGCSGADLYNIINTAAIRASAANKAYVSMADLEYAKDKILMGTERKSAVISEESRKLTAFHEGGHAVVASLTPYAAPIHMATIIPRGSALGLVYQLPKDETSISKAELLARIDIAMGGRVAEELIFGPDHITTGASSDLQQATKLATEMVLRWGMSDKVGSIYKSKEDLGNLSPEMRQEVDNEIKLILDKSYERAKFLLKNNRTKLDNLANALIQYESLNGEEVLDVIDGKKIREIKVILAAVPAPPQNLGSGINFLASSSTSNGTAAHIQNIQNDVNDKVLEIKIKNLESKGSLTNEELRTLNDLKKMRIKQI